MRRALAIVLALLLVPGALAVAAVAVLARPWKAAATGDAQLDRFGIRGWVVLYAVLTFGLKVDSAVIEALMGIVHQESKGDPANFLGDATLGGGPSIGPMQVYRSTAKSLNLWTPPASTAGDIDAERAAYALLASSPRIGIKWGVTVFKSKLDAANGNIGDAIHRYNGLGADETVYEQPVLDYVAQTFNDQVGDKVEEV